MPIYVDNDYDEYTEKKAKAIEHINKDNAHQVFEQSKNQIMAKLQTLDVRNPAQIGEFYLIVAQLTQAASCIAALNKASTKGTSFEQAINGIGTEDVAPILFNAFKDVPPSSLDKINLIDELHKPARQAWAGLHARMHLLADEVKAQHHTMLVLKENIHAYKEHLVSKLAERGVEFIPPLERISENTPPILQKMIQRYHAISNIEHSIRNKQSLSKTDMDFAKTQVKTCLENKPDWSERPFLQKLTDVLSLGMKPLYRAYFSKEKDMQSAIEQVIEPPKMTRR